MTNLIAIMHTTAAYQAAVLQLLAGEANFVAQSLELNDTIPSQTNQLVEWNVSLPAMGVGGSIVTSIYSFERGRLFSLSKRDWLRKATPEAPNLLALAGQLSRLDTNSVTRFATQSLAKLELDLSGLDQLPGHVFQVPARKLDEQGRNLRGHSNNLPTPLFQISWGSRPPPMDSFNPVKMKVLGTTPEIIDLRIREGRLLRRPPLVATNEDKLLGPLPPPRQFIAQLFGGDLASSTVSEPQRVEVSLLKGGFGEAGALEIRTGPISPERKTAQALSKALLDFNTYKWTVNKMCSPEYGMKARFIRGGAVVEVLFCFECDILEITFAGKSRTENFDFGHHEFVAIAKKLFPKDSKIRELKRNNPQQERQEFENELNRMTSK